MCIRDRYSIADATVSSLTEINTRLQELAEQSANGVYSPTQRKAIDAEAQALSKEYFRISRAAQFNGQRLFDGSMSSGLTLQLGYGVSGSIQSSVGGKLGDGSLSVTAVMTQTAENSGSVVSALRDLNGDGILDLVTGGTGGANGYVSVRLGQGDGNFGGASSYATGTSSVAALSLEDLNGDGFLDLLVAGNNGSSNGQVTVRLGNGNGTFGSTITTYAAETGGTLTMALGDLNTDGTPDLVTAGLNGRYTVRLGVGNGTFGSATSTTFFSGSSADLMIALADTNGDGALDLIGLGSAVYVALGRGNGTFAPASSVLATSYWTNFALTAGDVNGDG
ncbi:MAG: hypothetical protein EBZ48_18180, partial [Proteobacteria bacterium]|nr:hypothetical protein [Pseudomonadota bacterium]